MNTTQLKSFAAEARKSLLSGVKSKMNALGFKDNGSIDERDYPMQAADGTLFQGEIYDVSFYGKWMRLKDEIARYGFRQVCEEGAYTWFNRLMAIQILSRNGLIDPVLEFESPDVRIPLMVKQAHEGICPEMTAFDAARLNAVIDDDNRITDQFAILIVAYCQSTPILYKCFGTLNDFTELLLPTNILASNGFLNLLNGSTFISQDDYETTELIGWLYQFYISERKDEVFASFKKGHKADANDIPAATQIFTPNWIVKYMVQNTLGRIYLDNNPDSTLKDSWQYLVAAPEPIEGPRLKLSSLEDYTFADLSCGSGHILGEAFDLLYAIYIEEGYTRRQAIKAIFQRNLLGIDIDTRAKQLATFTLMLKACQQWADAINCEVMPRVLDMSGLTPPNYENFSDTLPHFFLGSTAKTKAETIAAINLMQQAANLGSIMKYDISPETRAAIAESMKRWEDEGLEDFEGLFPAMRLILALTEKYAAVVMNPPYMTHKNMNPELVSYIFSKYKDSKTDLFSVFIQLAKEKIKNDGKCALITMENWMFLSSFENLRKDIISNFQIDSLLHLGPKTFDEISGEVVKSAAFVLSKKMDNPVEGVYYKLIDYNSCSEKENAYLSKKCNSFYRKNSEFSSIKGSPISYWISSSVSSIFNKAESILNYIDTFQGIITGDNNKYLRLWQELDQYKLALHKHSMDDIDLSTTYWIPYNKGGDNRKWYGNQDYVVNWKNGPSDKVRGKAQFSNYYLKEYVSWAYMVGKTIATRYYPAGFLWDVHGSGIMDKTNSKYYLQALIGSCVGYFLFRINSSSMACQVENIIQLPIINDETKKQNVEKLVKDCITISKQDWDAHETSWDFQENELVRVFKEGKAKDLQGAVSAYKEEWENKFDQLHDNEEELNRQFIEIYGLQEELTPEVPYDEVTILQQGEISIVNE